MTFIIKQIRPRRKRLKLTRLIGPTIVVLLFVFLAGAISLAMLTVWVSRDLPNPNTLLDRNVAQSTKIYDRTGEHLLYDIHGNQARTLVRLEELPVYVKWTTIAIEDKNFYKHRGYVLRSIFRATLANVFNFGRVQGASTLTQQFVKNAILTHEKTLARKIKEFILSIQIERHFTKDQILQLYFNEIPYGRANYGIEAASQSYFGKSARDLALPEAATLAALTQAPTSYLNNTDRLMARRNLALDLTAEQGYITRDEAEAAKNVPLEIRQRLENITAPHFVLWVKEQLTQKYGERLVEQGGLRVITSLDFDKQKMAEEAVTAGMTKIQEKGGSNASLVALDPKTGQILALVGSHDYFDEESDGAVNVALRPRQPGSSFKPVVYLTGFLRGYTSTTILFDVNTSFKTDTRDYEPKNYDLKERGPVTVRQALAGSLNTPAVKMIYLAGVDHVLDLADSLGYSTLRDRSRFGLSLVLGGGEVKLLEHVSAYATFANEGLRFEPVSILKIEDAGQNVMEEWREREGRRIIDAEYVRELTNILQDNNARAFIFGAQNHLILPDRPVATKTGTTNDFHDAWTLGYTPTLAAGVWVGNNDNREMSRGADGSVVAAPIWQAFMTQALKGTPPEQFMPPQPVITGKPILDGQVGGETIVRIDRASGLLATEFTPPEWIEEKPYREAHSILYYVNKDDPRGPMPTDPSSDPQFERWEEAVSRWAGAQINSYFQNPPTLPDNLHVPENRPTLSVSSPASGSIISFPSIHITLNSSAPRGIKKISFIIDGALILERNAYYFDDNIDLPAGLAVGNHTLTILVHDDIDNSSYADIPFILR